MALSPGLRPALVDNLSSGDTSGLQGGREVCAQHLQQSLSPKNTNVSTIGQTFQQNLQFLINTSLEDTSVKCHSNTSWSNFKLTFSHILKEMSLWEMFFKVS